MSSRGPEVVDAASEGESQPEKEDIEDSPGSGDSLEINPAVFKTVDQLLFRY
jgi:hypothetical protein